MEWKTPFLGKCKVLMSQKLSDDTKTLYTKFQLDLWGVRIRAKSLKYWKCYRGAKKEYFQFSLMLGSERCTRMRRFQIWFQNWNRTIFNRLFGQKTVETWQIWQFCQFLSVFDSYLAKRGVQCHPISILRPDMESPHPDASFWPRNWWKLNILFFGPL